MTQRDAEALLHTLVWLSHKDRNTWFSDVKDIEWDSELLGLPRSPQKVKLWEQAIYLGLRLCIGSPMRTIYKQMRHKINFTIIHVEILPLKSMIDWYWNMRYEISNKKGATLSLGASHLIEANHLWKRLRRLYTRTVLLGTHSRAGAKSSVRRFVSDPLYERCIWPIILDFAC